MPCDKPSETAGLRVSGLECNLIALLLVWPREHSHIQAASPAYVVTGPSLPSWEGIVICGHPHPVNHIQSSPNSGLSELPWPVEAVDFHCPFPLSALTELNPWLPPQAALPFSSLISTELFLWYPLVVGGSLWILKEVWNFRAQNDLHRSSKLLPKWLINIKCLFFKLHFMVCKILLH